MKKNLIVLFSLSISFLFGCSGASDFPEIARTQGIVTYHGKPLSSANVIFAPETGPIAVGTTDEQGHFELLTQGKSGAKIGKHCVMIQAVAPKGGANVVSVDPVSGNEIGIEIVSRIPEKYGDLNRSGLNATVLSNEENSFSFDLK